MQVSLRATQPEGFRCSVRDHGRRGWALIARQRPPVLSANEIKPHAVETEGPPTQSGEILGAVIGLYLEHARPAGAAVRREESRVKPWNAPSRACPYEAGRRSAR